MEKNKLKELLRESLELFESKSANKSKAKTGHEYELHDKERQPANEKEIGASERQALRSLYYNNIKRHRQGGMISECVFGSKEDRSKLRQLMRGSKKDVANVGIPTKEQYEKIMGCISQNKNSIKGSI